MFRKRGREKWNALLCERKGIWSLRRRRNIWVVTWTTALVDDNVGRWIRDRPRLRYRLLLGLVVEGEVDDGTQS